MPFNLNNQAQALAMLNQVTQLENQLKMNAMSGLQQPQTGVDPMAALKMMTQLQALQGVKGKNAAPAKKGNVGVGLNDLMASLTGKQGKVESPCIWVAGLPEEYQDSQKLLNIFGNFGNVRRIVYTDKKPDGVLIQMDNARSAIKACIVTRNQTIGGKPFNVVQSKIERASIGKEDKKSMDVTKVKENWRFAKDSKFMKICMARLTKLSPKIVVSNIPVGKEDLLKKHIIEAGYTVKSMEGSHREDASKSGFTVQVIELASTEEAIGAVANLHNSWPKKMGTKNKDRFERERGLIFSFAGSLKAEREKAKAPKK
jgi:hypothetical protein